MSDSVKIYKAFKALTSKGGCYHDKWIMDESLVRILRRHVPSLKGIDNMRFKLVKRLNRDVGAFDDSNINKFYSATFQTGCPFDNKNRRIVYYYIGTGRHPKKPSAATDVTCTQAPSILSFSATNNRQRSCNKPEQLSFHEDTGSAGKKKKNNNPNKRKPTTTTASVTPTPKKKKSTETPRSPRRSDRLLKFVPNVTEINVLDIDEDEDDNNDEDANNNNSNSDDSGGTGDGEGDDSSSNKTPNIYWQSPEAALLFGFDEDADVYNGVQQIIKSLEVVAQSANGYEEANIIELHKDSQLTKHALWDLRNKCMYLRVAYVIALDKLCVGFRWKECCDRAARMINDLTQINAASGTTIMKWNRIFRVNHQFPNSDPYVANGIKRKPAVFEVFPTAAVDMSNFILDKLDHFTVELLREHFNTTMIDALNEEVTNNEGITEDSDEYQLVKRYINHPPSYSTVLRWVGYLGFKRQLSKKCYYVDGHEYPEQLRHRSWLTSEYLSVLEYRSHRWVHLSQTEYTELKESLDEGDKARDMLDQVAHKFKGDNDEDMLEFHVDKHDRLQEIANEKYGAFGGRVSVRKKEGDKPAIIFGQDEAIFNAHLSRTHQWVDPNGRRAIMPKTNGAGIMISAFQSRELGWGIPITEDQLSEINAARANQEYFDKEAAMAVNGHTKKMKLESSPGIIKFSYGNKNGYWSGNHMVLQAEDVIDCLKVILGDVYEYVFLFDSSSGHAKKRKNGLDAKELKKKWHSSSSEIRSTKIKEEEGYVGPYYDAYNPVMVTIGEEQTMMFTSESDKAVGPFWLTIEEREQLRYDREVEIPVNKRKPRDKTKAELIAELIQTHWGQTEGTDKLRKMLHAELAKKAEATGIDVKITPTTKTVYGWEGKGKGLLQIAYERGWVDLSTFSRGSYQVMKFDDDGNLIPDLSLRHLLANCTDFMMEQSQLEHVCGSIGARVIITTKYHCEYAGEGVEYSWGFSKAIYRRSPLALKKTTSDFLALVDQCISRDVLTIHMIRKFSKRARSYMETYKMLEMEAETDDHVSENLPIPHKRIETLKKMLKCHRAAIDFDKGFIMKTVDFDFKRDLISKEKKVNVTLRVKPETKKMKKKSPKKK